MPPETDPSEFENKPVLTDPQNWASRSHQELYAAVHTNNDPGQAGQISSEWGKYGSELTEAARTINAVITASESKWTGGAAEAARDAMKKLGDWVDETARTAVDVGKKVSEQGNVMEAARAQMPAPVQFDWAKVATVLAGPGTPAFVMAAADIAVTNAKARAAHDQAIAVMTNMEANSRQIDTSTPTFKPPFNPTTGKVEEPVLATRRLAPVSTLRGADALTSTHPQGAGAGTATAPTGTALSPGAVPPGAGSYTPAAAAMPAGGSYAPDAAAMPTGGSYTPAAAATPAGGSGGGSWATPPPPIRPDLTAAAAATYTPQPSSYTPQSFSGGGGNTYTSGTDYKPQFSGGGTPYPGAGPINRPGSTPRPNVTTPKPTIPPGLNDPNTYLPKDTNLPKGMTPGVTGGGGGGGGGAAAGGGAGAAAAAAAAMKGGAGGFGGGFGGAGAAGGGGAMQSGGAAGVAQGGRAMPTGMTLPGASAAAGSAAGGAGMGAGAGAAGGRGGEDKERKSASYIMGGDLFEVPGENLPPSVIGGTKPKKQKGPEQS
ncbi:PPE domain-containing protein [Lentzea nigeriaca]|uniref:PPE domain-containing protein n=1 Tax=Lentzea nigeriaca TaxID=1128665 RepID=UPI0019588331|nr:PPE domain-containing protein [Lentzea nigeriaca]MBM7858983.1 uncharacterized protein YukE [Lentzea nigeriaca]